MKVSHYILIVYLLITQIASAQETALDKNFNNKDKGFGIGDGFNGQVKTMVIQPDGKLLAGGSFTQYNSKVANYIARINPDGSIDTSFSNKAFGLNGNLNDIALQPDGKILLAGNFTTCNFYPANNIVRLNTDGSIDNTFYIGTGANNQVNAVAIQSDGKILLGGMFTSFNTSYISRLVRLNDDGSLDVTFNTGGGNYGPNGSVTAISIQPDNKILLGGSFSSYNQYNANGIARLKTNGKLDSSFNVGGTGTNNSINKILIQPDGKIILGGNFTSYNNISANYLVRTNADGTYDVGFNQSGSGANNSVYSVALQTDNKIVIAGSFTSYNDSTVHYMVRLNADGSTDTSLSTSIIRPDNVVYALAIQSDSKIIVAGYFFKYNDMVVNYIIRIQNNGIKDTTFNNGTGANNAVKALTIQVDGKLLVGGDFNNFNGHTCNNLIRLNTDGSRDNSFNNNETGPDNTVSAITIQPDNKILIGGSFTSYNGQVVSTIVRVNIDGTVDTNFKRPVALSVGQVFSIIVQTDGKIVVGGFYGTTSSLAASYITRLNSDGTIDGTFYYGGNVANGIVRTLALQPDGKILVGGDFAKYGNANVGCITRINTDGSKDASFNASGVGANSGVYTMALQSDGKVLIGGTFTTYNGIATNYITRLNANGNKDAGFNSNAVGADLQVLSIVLQADNKILVGGSFAKYNNNIVNHITRLFATGAKDSTFNTTGSGADNVVYALASQADNKAFYIGGNFTSYNGVGRNRLARVYIDSLLYHFAGNIITPLNKNIQNVSIVTNSDTVICSNKYNINIGNGNSQFIKAYKNNDLNKTNGISTLDMALIQSHILGKNKLNSPYKIIAADVNGDGKVTTLDIVYIKRLILGLDTTFNKALTNENRLWAFVDSSYKFPDSTNPFPFKDSINYLGQNINLNSQTLIGMKLGDVNWDWNPVLARMPKADIVKPEEE